jgi:benzoate-CoA ligase
MVKADSVCAYYWNQHEKTKDTIEGHWIRTGDKYYQDGDGYFWYAGRSDDMLKVSGVWVSPIEIESVLLEHVAVHEAAVVARPDEHLLPRTVACVVVREGVEANPALASELQAFVERRLASFKRPHQIEFYTELPKTATGKLLRFRLRERREEP